jgi:hypothetical protein
MVRATGVDARPVHAGEHLDEVFLWRAGRVIHAAQGPQHHAKFVRTKYCEIHGLLRRPVGVQRACQVAGSEGLERHAQRQT